MRMARASGLLGAGWAATLLVQQRRQCQRAEAEPGLLQESPPRGRGEPVGRVVMNIKLPQST